MTALLILATEVLIVCIRIHNISHSGKWKELGRSWRQKYRSKKYYELKQLLHIKGNQVVPSESACHPAIFWRSMLPFKLPPPPFKTEPSPHWSTKIDPWSPLQQQLLLTSILIHKLCVTLSLCHYCNMNFTSFHVPFSLSERESNKLSLRRSK